MNSLFSIQSKFQKQLLFYISVQSVQRFQLTRLHLHIIHHLVTQPVCRYNSIPFAVSPNLSHNIFIKTSYSHLNCCLSFLECYNKSLIFQDFPQKQSSRSTFQSLLQSLAFFQSPNYCIIIKTSHLIIPMRSISVQIVNIQNIVLISKNKRMSSRSLQQPQISEVAGFIAKTFEILTNDQFSKIVYWATSGEQFVIKDVNKFQQLVLPRYFRHNKMNSFIRQLNMYGFHKSRADHSKSVFSHPAFLKGRDDLLITIKRKIKGKAESIYPQTPQKRRSEIENALTAAKQHPQTGHQLTTQRNLSIRDINNPSFNFICTRQRLNSLMNLNVSVNLLPHSDMGQVRFEEESDDQCVSIEHKMEGERVEMTEPVKEHHYPKFMNPSCFFDSMRK